MDHAPVRRLEAAGQHPPGAAEARSGRDARGDQAHRHAAECRGRGTNADDPVASPATELIAISPGGELRTLRDADAHDLEPLLQPGEADVLGRRPEARVAEAALALLDRLPPLLERREVPPLASTADDPQPSLRRVKRQALPHGKLLDRRVRAERVVAEEARRVHENNIAPRK